MPKLGNIAAVDENAGQVGTVQFDRPAFAARRDEYVGRDRQHIFAFEPATGLWIIAAQFYQHIAQVFVVDAAHALKLVKRTLCHQVEIVDKLGHARVITIRLARLNGKAFGQVSRANAGWIEPLKLRKRRLHFCHGNAKPVRRRHQVFANIARGFDMFDNLLDQKQLPSGQAGPCLRHQMFTQADVARGKAVEIRAVGVKATGRCAARKPKHAIGPAHAVRWGVMVERFCAEIDIQRVRCALAIATQQVVTRPLATVVQCGREILGRRIRGSVAGACFQNGITFHLFRDKCFNFERRQCQQFNRLLQLRCHHQRLALAKIETGC